MWIYFRDKFNYKEAAVVIILVLLMVTVLALRLSGMW